MKKSLEAFFEQNPALFYGIMFLLGISYALYEKVIVLLCVTVLLGVFFHRKTFTKLLLALVLFFSAFVWCKMSSTFPNLPKDGILGDAEIEIHSITAKTTHFGKKWIYKGKIVKFISENQMIGANLPFSLSLPINDAIERPIANQSYKVYARLKNGRNSFYTLNVEKNTPWYPVNGSWSLAEYRFQTKEKVVQYIANKYNTESVSSFLNGIATGDFDNRDLAFEFGRFGLQHIMAISGFHFGIIATIMIFFLQFTFSYKRSALILLFLLTLYFVFLGCSPSILRAWTMSTVVLGGLLLEKRGSSLNSLGTALLITLAYDPFFCTSIGFQFSFISTAAILLLYPFFERYCEKIFPKRNLSQMITMDLLSQHAYCFLSYCRQGMALLFAVNAVALPMTIFYFQKFPVLGLLYNLFFPFLVSISMFLLILGSMFSLIISPIGDLIHTINNFFTEFILNLTSNFPTTLEIVWHLPTFSSNLLILYLSVLFILSIMLSQKDEREVNFI